MDIDSLEECANLFSDLLRAEIIETVKDRVSAEVAKLKKYGVGKEVASLEYELEKTKKRCADLDDHNRILTGVLASHGITTWADSPPVNGAVE